MLNDIFIDELKKRVEELEDKLVRHTDYSDYIAKTVNDIMDKSDKRTEYFDYVIDRYLQGNVVSMNKFQKESEEERLHREKIENVKGKIDKFLKQ